MQNEPLTREETKEVFNEVIDERIEMLYARFGKWVSFAIASASFGALMYILLRTNGWHK